MSSNGGGPGKAGGGAEEVTGTALRNATGGIEADF